MIKIHWLTVLNFVTKFPCRMDRTTLLLIQTLQELILQLNRIDARTPSQLVHERIMLNSSSDSTVENEIDLN